MKTRTIMVLVVLAAIASSVPAGAAPLTLAGVLELTAAAPEVRVAATRVEEEEGKVLGAQPLLMENPKVDGSVGPRFGRESGADFEIGVEIPIEWGRRDKRLALAEAGLKREKLAVSEARRQAAIAAVTSYYQVLEAQERLRVAEERKALGAELLRVAAERYQLGDAPKFDVSLARTEVARSESEVASAVGSLAAERSGLARVLGMPGSADLKVEGDIRDRSFFDGIASGTPAADRSDLQAALADLQAADAAIAFARSEQRPEVAFRMSYTREGEDNVALAGLSFTLPFVNRKEGAVREAQARKHRAEIIAENIRTAAATEIEGARLAYAAAVEAVRRMEVDALPLQSENESMATESYRAGKINLSTLLQVRREALETRKEYLERLLQAASAGAELASAAGAFAGR